MTLQDWAEDALDSFVSVGGTLDMYKAATFMTESQAYYCGQVVAYQKILYSFGRKHALTYKGVVYDTDFYALEKAYQEYQ